MSFMLMKFNFRNFLKYIRRYNYAFAMTSLGCKEETFPSGFKPTFKICGRAYHRHRSYLALSVLC